MGKYPDISHWHPVSNWALAKANCPFLISKATQGTSFIDSTLDSFIQGCEAHEISYWLYVFLNKGNELEQANFLVNTCKGKVGKHFIGYVLDVEKKNNAEDVRKALDYVSGLGYKTMLYTMHSQYSLYKSVIEERPPECAWWEARYGLNNGVYSSLYPCHEGADLHQFTSKGLCEGISGNCDLNRIVQKGESWYTTPLEKEEREDAIMGKYASNVVEQAKAWIGKKESNGTHKSIIDLYNSHKPLARSYKVKYTDSWCATFVSAVAIKLGYTDIIPIECSCQKMIELFKAIGCWQENESITPKAGYIIFYDWQDSGSGDNKGWSDHVGIVEKVSLGKITVIEGNYNDAVKRRTLSVNGRNIRGYGVPKYDAEEQVKAEKPSVTAKTAKKSAKSFEAFLAGTYKVTASALHVREGAGTLNASMVTIPKGTAVKCYGYYTAVLGTKWLYVQFEYKGIQYTGFASSKYLKK